MYYTCFNVTWAYSKSESRGLYSQRPKQRKHRLLHSGEECECHGYSTSEASSVSLRDVRCFQSKGLIISVVYRSKISVRNNFFIHFTLNVLLMRLTRNLTKHKLTSALKMREVCSCESLSVPVELYWISGIIVWAGSLLDYSVRPSNKFTQNSTTRRPKLLSGESWRKPEGNLSWIWIYVLKGDIRSFSEWEHELW